MVHGDLKPQNILTSKNLTKDSLLYLIDYGICQPYQDDEGNHLPKVLNSGFSGTIAFSAAKDNISYSNYKLTYSVGLSRKDDLMSLMYVLIYLYKSTLPWLKGDSYFKK